MNKIAVVILNYNGEKLLQQFLPTVIEHSKNASVIVADNASTDQSIEILSKSFPSVTIIRLEKNYGFCGGYNKALKQINASYFVLLNSDVEVTSGWLDPLEALLDSNPNIAAVQPKILSYHQQDHFEYAGAAGGFIDSFGYPFCRGRLFDFTEIDHQQYNDTREIFWATGACMMIRSDVYRKLEGLDEDFFAHMEEIDLCWKIQRMGLQVFYCGVSRVYHVGAGTLSRSNPRKTFYNFRNGLTLIFKHWSSGALLIKFPLRILLDYVALFKFLITGKLADASAILKAHIQFIKGLNRARAKRKALQSQYPISNRNVYRGLVLWDYFALRKKGINVP
ncbi:MAG TPA: glycosyltransferase family 2 protein [Cyclobacteriaceae bacterium]|nr:glycosyltransferase family 2 protein [Cyclobacteriaceae bacterium]